MKHFKEELGRVKAFVFDVDGVLASSRVILHPSHDLMRTMNIKDGYALHYAVRKGYPIGIITGGNSETVGNRFKNLGITDVYMRSHDKVENLKDFLAKYGLDASEVLYMGDDMPDYLAMQEVGFPTCPADAVEEIKAIATYISDKAGGEGCARDVIEQVLRLQGRWMEKDAFTW